VRRFMATAMVGAAIAAGCAGTTPPNPPIIETVGILEAELIFAEPKRRYQLADGRTFEISTDQTRVLFEGGLGHPFVMGRDAAGPFVASFAGQVGLPETCHIIPVAGPGIERGAYIEVQGVLWSKAPGFATTVPTPGLGAEWPGAARFCFDELARITTVVP